MQQSNLLAVSFITKPYTFKLLLLVHFVLLVSKISIVSIFFLFGILKLVIYCIQNLLSFVFTALYSLVILLVLYLYSSTSNIVLKFQYVLLMHHHV